MIEIKTRTFGIDEGEDIITCSSIIQRMPGYYGHMQISGGIITAEFKEKLT